MSRSKDFWEGSETNQSPGNGSVWAAADICDSLAWTHNCVLHVLLADEETEALSRAVGDLSLLAIFAGRVLDECYDPACHEPGGPHGFARARHLDDLDDPAPRRDLDVATSSCGDDLVSPRTVVCGNNDLDTIALHRASVPRRSGPARCCGAGAQHRAMREVLSPCATRSSD